MRPVFGIIHAFARLETQLKTTEMRNDGMRGTINGRTLFALCCIAAAFAHGKTCTWTGAGDGVTYASDDNWDNGVPEAEDVVVFNPQGDLFVAFSADAKVWSELRFESGNTVLGFSPGKNKANIGFMKTGASIYVSDNATAVISNRVAFSAAKAQFTMYGGGGLTFYSDQVDNAGYCNLIDIASGTVTYCGGGGQGHHKWQARLTRVYPNAVFNVKGSLPFSGKAPYGHEGYASVQVDKGGVLDLYNTTSAGSGMGAIFGEGRLRIGGNCPLLFVQDQGPASFGGEIEYYNNATLTVTFSAVDGVPAENLSYTLLSENAFAGVKVVDHGALRFAPGSDTYRLGSWMGSDGFNELVTADTNGNPITIYTGIGGIDHFRASGPGNLMLTTGGTITGDVISIEGTLGLVGAAKWYYFGDGTDAANDADLSSLRELHIDTTASGTVTFQNVNPTFYGFPLTGSGTLNMFGENHFGMFRYKAPTSSYSAYAVGTLTTENPDGYSCIFMHFSADTTWNILGGEWYRGHKMNSADTVSILPCRQGMVPIGNVGSMIVVSNAFCYFDRIVAEHSLPDFTVIDGGTMVMNTNFKVHGSATPEDPAVLAFDGGTFLGSFLGNGAKGTFNPLDGSLSNLVVKVGPGGMALGTIYTGPTAEHRFTIACPILPLSGQDGGLTRKVGEGTLVFKAPVSLSGPFRSLDGTIEVNPSVGDIASNPAWLGTGDMHLRDSVIDISPLADGNAVEFATGSGRKFTYSNTAAIRFSVGDATAAQAKHVTIGPSGAAAGTALVRGGKGASCICGIAFRRETDVSTGRYPPSPSTAAWRRTRTASRKIRSSSTTTTRTAAISPRATRTAPYAPSRATRRNGTMKPPLPATFSFSPPHP